jgi:hypothetical protein
MTSKGYLSTYPFPMILKGTILLTIVDYPTITHATKRRHTFINLKIRCGLIDKIFRRPGQRAKYIRIILEDSTR